jgi:hypothetical protein
VLQPNGEIWRFSPKKMKKKRRNLATRKQKKTHIFSQFGRKKATKLAKSNEEKNHWVHPNLKPFNLSQAFPVF